MNTPLKSLFIAAIALLASNATFAQTTGARSSHILRELLPDGSSCTPQTTQELFREHTYLAADFRSMIRVLENKHWLLADKLEREVYSLTFCASNRTLRRVQPEALNDVTVYLQNGIQVAVRHGVEVYLDMNVFRRMSARAQTLVIATEALHSFIGFNVPDRDTKIRSLAAALSAVMGGTMTREELARQIESNGVDSRVIPAQVVELPTDIAQLYRTLRTWDTSRPEEERLVTRLRLYNRVMALPQEQREELVRFMLSGENSTQSARAPLVDHARLADNDAEFARRISLLGALSTEEKQAAFIFAMHKNWLGTAQTILNNLDAQAQQRTLGQVISDWAQLPFIEAWYDSATKQRAIDSFPQQALVEFVVSRIRQNNHQHLTEGEANSLSFASSGRPEARGSLVYLFALRAINYNQPALAQLLLRHFNVSINFADNEILTLAVSGNANISLRLIFRGNPQMRSQRRDLQLATHMGNNDTFNMIWHNSLPSDRNARVHYSYFSALTQAAILTNINWDAYMDLLEIAILSGNTNAVRVIANDPAGPLGRNDRRNHAQLAVSYSRVVGTANARAIAEIVATAQTP